MFKPQKRTRYYRDNYDRPKYETKWLVFDGCEFVKDPKRFTVTEQSDNAHNFTDQDGAEAFSGTMNAFEKEKEKWISKIKDC
jgi:hypothetical protein